MRLLTVVFLCVILSACVSVPKEYLTPCAIPQKQNETVEEAVRLANARLESINECNAKIAKIKAIVEK